MIRKSPSRRQSPSKSPKGAMSHQSSSSHKQKSLQHIRPQLQRVRQEIHIAQAQFNRKSQVNLVAVSKTHDAYAVRKAYDLGQRHFGENYVAELIQKAPDCPSDVRWHFIGHLQSNKCKQLVSIPNLHVVETVDSSRLAQKLNKACIDVKRAEPLNVLIQVNTSGEESKSGVPPSECVSLTKYVVEECSHLAFRGLMTIGRFEPDPSGQYFKILNQCKEDILKQFPDIVKIKQSCSPYYTNDSSSVVSTSDDDEDGDNDVTGQDDDVAMIRPGDGEAFIMSMGMSHDYETAVRYGTTQLRVGTAIFGARMYNNATVSNNVGSPTELLGETDTPQIDTVGASHDAVLKGFDATGSDTNAEKE